MAVHLYVLHPKYEVQQEYEQHLDFSPVMYYEETNRISSSP